MATFRQVVPCRHMKRQPPFLSFSFGRPQSFVSLYRAPVSCTCIMLYSRRRDGGMTPIGTFTDPANFQSLCFMCNERVVDRSRTRQTAEEQRSSRIACPVSVALSLAVLSTTAKSAFAGRRLSHDFLCLSQFSVTDMRPISQQTFSTPS